MQPLLNKQQSTIELIHSKVKISEKLQLNGLSFVNKSVLERLRISDLLE
ncbi:MAG: hypothetical protein OFPI_42530 [Osedax symbiont Rs2]|nr:MAG: hypothetical protein OFPI_42530 [Osedax symbiont Rs2]